MTIEDLEGDLAAIRFLNPAAGRCLSYRLMARTSYVLTLEWHTPRRTNRRNGGTSDRLSIRMLERSHRSNTYSKCTVVVLLILVIKAVTVLHTLDTQADQF